MTTLPPFVRLLASVTSEAEARLAAGAGADVIDAKDPVAGALGALPHVTVAAICAAARSTCHPGRRDSAEQGPRAQGAPPPQIPVSATVGDLPLDPILVTQAARAMAATGVDIVKVGLFPGGDAQAVIQALGREIAPETSLVAVLLADAPLDLALVRDLGTAGFAGVMLDTAAKDGRTLLDHCAPETLARFIAEARAAGLFAGLAGSLRLAQIPELLALAPDILGFRGALCRASDRKATLDAAALAAVRAAIPRASSPSPLCRRHVSDTTRGKPRGEESPRSARTLETTS